MDDLLACYFGCVGIRLNHTLLDLPDHPSPRLCEDHSESWRAYRSTRITETGTIDWPADFWPWAKRMEQEMTKEQVGSAQETRAHGTEILASEAIPGFWYEVPSGEVERCVGIRNRGRGAQVGFVGIDDSGADPEDVRWLPGKTSILVESEVEVAKLMRAFVENRSGEKNPPNLAFALYPRNGLVCAECHLPQRETPYGATCDTGHGGAEGRDPKEVANQLGEDGYTEEAQAVLNSVPSEHPRGAYTQAMTEEFSVAQAEIALAIDGVEPPLQKEKSESGSPLVTEWARALAGPSSIFHKSLHVDWRTPKPIFDAWVARWGPAWLDAAATKDNKLCEYWLGPGADVDDALSVDWEPTQEIITEYGKNIWLNHPYSKGEKKCAPDCQKPKCAERGYHLDRPIAPSGDWMIYARNQALGSALKFGGALGCLTKRSGETQWWKEAVRHAPESAGVFVTGRVDPMGGPAREFMDATEYKAAMWMELRWTKFVVDIVEIEGRVDFDRGGDDGSAGFPSVLITYYRP